MTDPCPPLLKEVLNAVLTFQREDGKSAVPERIIKRPPAPFFPLTAPDSAVPPTCPLTTNRGGLVASAS